MAEICISIASKVAEYLVDPILQPICYAFKYQRNMEELKRQVKKLTSEREGWAREGAPGMLGRWGR